MIHIRGLANGLYIFTLVVLSSLGGTVDTVARQEIGRAAGPVISKIATNEADFPGRRVRAYEKFEITFQVNSAAANPYLPYDANPPEGVEPGTGITVEGLFSPDGFKTVYSVPAFYTQAFTDQVKGGREWFYPLASYSWKIRFSPPTPGTWQYRIRGHDRSGISESSRRLFLVSPSSSKGFIRVSQADPRYFAFEDQSYFPALGYNMNFNHASWENPVLDNQANFQAMSENGIQLVRIWLSQWSIFGSAWNPWNSPDPALHGRYIPYSGLTTEQAMPQSQVSMKLDAQKNPCMFTGWLKAPPAVKRNTTYRVRVRYRLDEIGEPVRPGQSHGLVAKIGGVRWEKACAGADIGEPVTPYVHQRSAGWQILEGSLVTGSYDFLPYFSLVLENTRQGRAYIDTVWIEEDLGSQGFGPNILSKPWMAHHLYMDQRNAYAMDKLVALAEQNDVYLKLVVLEKNDWIFKHFDHNGEPLHERNCGKGSKNCPGVAWFYSDGRRMTMSRWLYQAWWRYLQARWGYSTHIHSYELMNEGDPNKTEHYELADEFGKFMHQFRPNDHLVTTSFWHSFPKDRFWGNPAYANIDYADLHDYIEAGEPEFFDSAQATYQPSMKFYQSAVPLRKPIMRGEVGFTEKDRKKTDRLFEEDTNGVWLHHFLWGGINPGGMIESYWFEDRHIYRYDLEGRLLFDHRPLFKAFANFIADIPLNNGYYQDARADTSSEALAAWGQMDRKNGRAHLWIFNRGYTWKNTVARAVISPITGFVSIPGFQPGARYQIEWWDTDQPEQAKQVLSSEVHTAPATGILRLDLLRLQKDIAVKIERIP